LSPLQTEEASLSKAADRDTPDREINSAFWTQNARTQAAIEGSKGALAQYALRSGGGILCGAAGALLTLKGLFGNRSR
jgi:hypothetical protein